MLNQINDSLHQDGKYIPNVFENLVYDENVTFVIYYVKTIFILYIFSTLSHIEREQKRVHLTKN